MSRHVGMFVNYFSIVRGGAEMYVADLSRHLVALGFRITVVTGRSLLRRPAPAREDLPIIHEPCLYELRELGRLVPGRVEWVLSTVSESFYNLFARRHVGKFDIVHSHGFDTARAALDSPARRGPVVLTMHGAPTDRPRVGRMLRRLDALISPSEWIRDQVRRDHGVEARLLTTGVDLELFAPMDRAEARSRLGWGDEPVVLFVGRLVQEKDVPTLLRAFKLLTHAREKARLRIVGEGILARKLRAEAVDLGLQGRAEFLGAQLRERLPHYYAAADVVAVPSLHENFPMVALEALACGARLVVSDAVTAVTRRFHEVASFPCGDHRRLAARLEAGLDGRMNPVASRLVEPYSWRQVASSYADIYEALAARRAA